MKYVTPFVNPDISAERLRSILKYDPATGFLYWRRRDDVGEWWNGRYAGKRAGMTNGQGYVDVAIDNRKIRAHRVIWCYVTGEWPDTEVDHRDTDRQNNRFKNLRKASVEQQRMNMSLHKDSQTGFKGVSLNKRFGYRSRIWVGKKEVTLGYFRTAEEAHAAYVAAARKHFGQFARSE